MRHYLLCSRCEWSFTIDHLVEMAECPSCGEFVPTEDGTQRYSEKQAAIQSFQSDEIATSVIQTPKIEQSLTRQQKAELLKEENRREKELAAKAAEEKEAAERWAEEQEQYKSIARILDGKELIRKAAAKRKRDKQAIAIVASIAGILVIWLCYIVSSCARETTHTKESGLGIGEATKYTPTRQTNPISNQRAK